MVPLALAGDCTRPSTGVPGMSIRLLFREGQHVPDDFGSNPDSVMDSVTQHVMDSVTLHVSSAAGGARGFLSREEEQVRGPDACWAYDGRSEHDAHSRYLIQKRDPTCLSH